MRYIKNIGNHELLVDDRGNLKRGDKFIFNPYEYSKLNDLKKGQYKLYFQYNLNEDIYNIDTEKVINDLFSKLILDKCILDFDITNKLFSFHKTGDGKYFIELPNSNINLCLTFKSIEKIHKNEFAIITDENILIEYIQKVKITSPSDLTLLPIIKFL